MRVLVTGASGLLGGAVVRAAERRGHHVVAARHRTATPPGIEWRAMDATDRASVREAVEGIDAVVHTAYERPGDPSPAAQARRRAVNVGAPANVAAACAATRTALVHVSSDVVFPGDRPAGSPAWTEADPPDPLSGFAYGQEKADAEAAVTSAHRGACIVRTSLLYDLRGTNPLERSVLEGTSPRHFTDEYRCAVHVDDVAEGILSLLGLDEPPAVVHLAGPRRMSRFEIATEIARHHGLDPALLVPGRAADHPAPRPRDLDLSITLARGLLGWDPRDLADDGP